MKSIRFLLLLILTILTAGATFAQGSYKHDNTIPVTINGNLLKNPWVGGFNAPIFSEIDMNGDGIKDLFVFDKDGSRITTYLNNGTPNTIDYVFAPEYKEKFPSGMHDWVLLVDYNCDDKEDVFTYSYSGGMTVYTNITTPTSGLKFELTYTLVHSNYGTVNANLFVASVNLPALTDADYDGDMDVLTFPVSGNFVEFHRNMAKELFNRCDTLIYQMDPDCFGSFGLSGGSNSAILGISCRQGNPQPPDPTTVQHGMHSGSCMIAVDIDGDNDKDLLNGDILGDNILLVGNGGSSAAANMTFQDTAFPSYDVPVDLFTFPSPYYIDVNNDGNKDLVVAPCIAGPAENINNVLLYMNTTNNQTNVFNYQANRFLSNEMIELGAGANVTFVDINNDGLKDIVAGNFGYYDTILPFQSGLAYFKNTGTAQAPAFTLQTTNFGGFFSLPLDGLDPAFGDLDHDGDLDLILGHSDGTLMAYLNTAGPGNPPVFALAQAQLLNNFGQVIDVGQYSAPQLVDVNRDGKLDLIIGERSGYINYYENTGTLTVPSFTLNNANWGGVNVNNVFSLYGYSNPCLYDSAGSYQLLVGAVNGYIYQYNHIDSNLNGQFTLVDSMYYNIFEPAKVNVDVADLDGDGVLELLTANNAGGLSMYKFDATSGIPPVTVAHNPFTVYPNPASGELNITFSQPPVGLRTITLFDVAGRLVTERETHAGFTTFDVSRLAPGMYHCRVIENNQVYVVKFVIR